jgi:transposase
VAAALGRDAHTVGGWLAAVRRDGPAALALLHTGGSPPVLHPAQQAQRKAAVQRPPREAGIAWADWHGKVVRRFVSERCGITRARRTCRTSLRRLGFVVKRPKQRLRKADAATRAAFVATDAARRTAAETHGANHCFVAAAHCSAAVDRRGTWVRTGTPALVDATSPRSGEQASSDAAVCLETGAVAALPLAGHACAATATACLPQWRAPHPAPLVVCWDNAPAHGGDPLREYLRTPQRRLRLVRLPGYRPACNADEQRWAWVRAEVTAHTCFGTQAQVSAHVDPFFAGLAARTDEVKRRCRTALQRSADALDAERAAPALLQDVRKAA